MSKEKESVQERLARMQREKEAAQAAQTTDQEPKLVSMMVHETDGSPNFDELAKKLEEMKAKEAKGENEGHVKMTIYVEESLARSFNALITKRGQQKAFVNQALSDFVIKKSKELGM